MFKRVGIFLNPRIPTDFADQISNVLTNLGFNIVVISNQVDEIISSNPDLVISVGGDGTLIKIAKLFQGPILPINFDSIGAMIEVTRENFEQYLNKISEGDYRIERVRYLVGRILSEKGYKELDKALNEFLVIKSKLGRIFKAIVYLDNSRVGILRSDGFIVSTPFGSTGHSFSIGGAVLHPGLQAYIFTPLAPLYRRFPPIVIPADSKLLIELLTDSLVVVDGGYEYDISKGAKLEFMLSDKYAQIIRFSDLSGRLTKTLRVMCGSKMEI